MKELGALYRSMINNIINDKDIFIKKKYKGIYEYSLNIDYIRKHIKLNQFSNKNLTLNNPILQFINCPKINE
jgi:hypothetical protein